MTAAPLRALAGALQNRNLRLLCPAWACSRSAEWAFHVVLGVYAYESGGTVAVGVVVFVRMAPAAVASLFGTVLADRFARDRVLTGIELARTALAVGAALAVATGAPLAVVYALAACHAVASSVSLPTVLSLLPSLVHTPAELVRANAAILTVQGLGTLTGPLLGGIVVAAAGPGAGFTAAAVASGLATALLVGLRVEGAVVRAPAAGRRVHDALAGFATVARAPGIRLIVVLFGCQTLIRGGLTVLTVVVALDLLGLSQSWVGLLTAAPGLGSLLGALGARRLAGRRLALPFLLGLAVWGAPMLVIGAWPGPALALGALVVVGIGDAFLDVSGYTLLQRIVPNDLLGRVFGVHGATTFATVAIGSLATPAIIGLVGTRWTLAACGAALPLLALAVAARVGAIDRGAVPPAQELALIARVPMFAALSVAAAEQVASCLVPVGVARGEEIIRRGDQGDRFYIVDDGAFELVRDGRSIVVSDRGDYFGEVALLRDVPRTTTVTAVADSRLYALGRADFLAAVNGHSAGVVASRTVLEERLQGV